MLDKKNLRTQIQQQRNALSTKAITQAALNIKQKIITHPNIKNAKKIGAYLACNNELDLGPSIEALLEMGKEIFIPILHPVHNTFWFAPWQNNFKKNKFGIEEPVYKCSELLAPWDLDIALVPLIAADHAGHRIGMGKGYYDRSFAFKKFTETPILIGCSYAFQIQKKLPHEDFDILMDEIIHL
jgi:5-formyltetrahydrofolate cyclo-ligase